jgi:transcriptional regulator with XRE-family HTH domain
MFLSNKLKYFMATNQISITQLANNINVSPTTISEILNGIRANPRPETIHTLAKYFGVDISEFYDDEINKELASKANKNIYFPNLKTALSHLLIKTGIISTASLYKLSGIPKHTLDRILNEEIVTPNMTTLQQIAKFFNLTVAQITGLEPIYSNQSSNINLEQKILPLIRFGELQAWLNGNLDEKIERAEDEK